MQLLHSTPIKNGYRIHKLDKVLTSGDVDGKDFSGWKVIYG